MVTTLRKLLGFFPLPPLRLEVAQERHAGRIRAAMLDMLRTHSGRGVQRVAQRVQFADDLEALWYLRQDVMTALSDIDGESAARRKMKDINGMFKGRLPHAMVPRPHRRG